MDDFLAKRWDTKDNPKDLKPIEAVKALLRDMEAGKPVDHVMILVWADGPEGGTGWYQAGNLDSLSQLGMLTRLQIQMEEVRKLP